MARSPIHVSGTHSFIREMAVGNTFGATALSSYGGFWIAYGILLTPNWNILGKGGPYDATTLAAAGHDPHMANSAVGFFLTGWFIFTTILLLCTLRSTVMFFLLFFTLDLAFLMLACGEYATNNGAAIAAVKLTKAGGGFGMLAAFLAWYNAFAGIADSRSVTPYTSFLSFFLHSVTVFLGVCSSHTQDPKSRRWKPLLAVPLLGGSRSAKPPSVLVVQATCVSNRSYCQPMLTRLSRAFFSRSLHNVTGQPQLCLPQKLTLSRNSNSFFLIPVFHFPWSEKGREARKTEHIA